MGKEYASRALRYVAMVIIYVPKLLEPIRYLSVNEVFAIRFNYNIVFKFTMNWKRRIIN